MEVLLSSYLLILVNFMEIWLNSVFLQCWNVAMRCPLCFYVAFYGEIAKMTTKLRRKLNRDSSEATKVDYNYLSACQAFFLNFSLDLLTSHEDDPTPIPSSRQRIWYIDFTL